MRLLFSFMLFCSGFSLYAQNLVPDPGFEAYKRIPSGFSYTAKDYTNAVENWFVPTFGTPDYFHAQSRGNASTVKNNFAGNQKAQEGKAYSGFYACLYLHDNYREYLEVKLLSPLLAGQVYTIQFHISLSESSEYAVSRIGALLLRKKYTQDDYACIRIPGAVESPDSIFYENKKDWMLVRLRYTASGGERYLVLGNFRSGNEMELKKVQVNKKHYFKENGSYYFIDNVSVSTQMDFSEKIYTGERMPPPEQAADSSVEITRTPPAVLRFVYFDTDRSELKPESYPSLDSLVLYLKSDTSWSILITGHTDSTGKEEHNLELSSQRARAVAVYLAAGGIAAKRISYEGRGSSRPVADNISAEGRMCNRRVEYVLLK